MTGDRAEGGFTSVPLMVVVLAAMTTVFLVCLESGNVVYAWLRAQQAAEAGAAAWGGDPPAEDVASAALSRRLREAASVEARRREVVVRVRPPALTPLGGVAPQVTGRATAPGPPTSRVPTSAAPSTGS